MRPSVLLVTQADGTVVRVNLAAKGLLGEPAGATCDALVCARSGESGICTVGCASTFTEGEQRDHGLVTVRGGAGHLVCNEVAGARVITLTPVETNPGTPTLTEREREVLVLIARGFRSLSIGRRLGVATCTVRTHVEHIREKLHVRTRGQAVARGLALGEIE